MLHALGLPQESTKVQCSNNIATGQHVDAPIVFKDIAPLRRLLEAGCTYKIELSPSYIPLLFYGTNKI